MLLSGTEILGTLLPWDMESHPSIPLTLGLWGSSEEMLTLE